MTSDFPNGIQLVSDRYFLGFKFRESGFRVYVFLLVPLHMPKFIEKNKNGRIVRKVMKKEVPGENTSTFRY